LPDRACDDATFADIPKCAKIMVARIRIADAPNQTGDTRFCPLRKVGIAGPDCPVEWPHVAALTNGVVLEPATIRPLFSAARGEVVTRAVLGEEEPGSDSIGTD
jgi:hypothetical protein